MHLSLVIQIHSVDPLAISCPAQTSNAHIGLFSAFESIGTAAGP